MTNTVEYEIEKILRQLDPQALLIAASEEAGLDDFGDMGFMEPLTVLMNALVAEANLNEMGRILVRSRVTQSLVNRLRVQQALKEHPEILEEDVSDPIIIIGFPRTGTTKLQRMMSEDTAVQKCHLWKLLNPAPLPGWEPSTRDERVLLAQESMQAMAQLQPDFHAGHPMSAEEADEDVFMMEMSFEGILPIIQYHVPSYEDWFQKRNRQYFYSYQKVLFQYLQWQDGGRRNRPWLLKAATHLSGFETLSKTFPKATFVHCHRNVSDFFASTLRVGEGYRKLVTNDLDNIDLGVDYTRLYLREKTLYLEQRKRLAEQLRIIDVAYKDIVADPISIIRRVRELHDLPLTSAGEGAMLAWVSDNPQYRFGRLEYSLERYGLDKERVEKSFSDYCQQFSKWL